LEKEILRMMEEVNLRYHLKAIMPETPFVVAFNNGVEVRMVSFGKNIELAVGKGENYESDFIVEGSPEQISVLLDGREKLTVLSGRQEISVIGTYRGLLFVESILTLCRIHDAEPVVI
jgi:hypothetical protein